MRVQWTRKALLNLDNAIEYIANDNPSAAQKVAQQIWDSSQLLVSRPRMGRPGRVSGTRELIITNLPYILPYVEKSQTIFILRVIHTSMKWPSVLKKFGGRGTGYSTRSPV